MESEKEDHSLFYNKANQIERMEEPAKVSYT